MRRVTQPFARELRWRMVASADSITFVVRRCTQCAAGKSEAEEQSGEQRRGNEGVGGRPALGKQCRLVHRSG